MSVINSYNNWGKLEEVFLGDVYPASWYDHLPTDVRDCFQELTEKTKEDLRVIEKLIESFGVVVRRPVYEHIDDYVHPYTQHLIKPDITPRDFFLTAGKTLYAKRSHIKKDPWQVHLDYYVSQGGDVQPVLKTAELLDLIGASTVRAGKDIYFDLTIHNRPTENSELTEIFKKNYLAKFNDYRVHLLFNGGHTDSCFSLLKPGVILTSKYFDDYERTFPGWKLINVASPQFANHSWSKCPGNGKWYLPGFDNKAPAIKNAFNEHVIGHAMSWVGNYTETFFEVNCLVIDEHNIIIPGENEAVFRELSKVGITAHPVPFRTRTFWDGGIHCITLDIRRQGGPEDLFPNRGTEPLTVYN